MRKISEAEATELSKQHYCKVIIKKIKSQKKFDSFHQSMISSSKNNYKVEVIDASEVLENVDAKKLEENIQQNSSALEIINTYLDGLTLDNGLDKDCLKTVMEELYKDVLIQQKESVA